MDGDAGGVINREALRGYVSRVASLHDQRDELNADIREVYREAKDAGFDTTVLREIVREYRTDAEPRQSRYALLDAYRSALGMLADTPLGEAAIVREYGRSDAGNGNREHADYYPPGAEHHGDYELGHQDAEIAAAKPKRRRGRPRKERVLDFEFDGEPAGTA